MTISTNTYTVDKEVYFIYRYDTSTILLIQAILITYKLIQPYMNNKQVTKTLINIKA